MFSIVTQINSFQLYAAHNGAAAYSLPYSNMKESLGNEMHPASCNPSPPLAASAVHL